MTERRLVLIRHAKAEQGVHDVGRRLTPRGGRDSRALGRWLVGWGAVPDRVIVSPAKRARETWELAAEEVSVPPPVDVDDRVYENTVEDLLGTIRDAPSSVLTLAIVGHNPSMQALAAGLAEGSTGPAVASLAEKYPTCAVAVFAVEGGWAGAGPSTASLSAFEVPRGAK